jgi:hypothetical protein
MTDALEVPLRKSAAAKFCATGALLLVLFTQKKKWPGKLHSGQFFL